jgi:hypothetical protein
MIRLLAFKDSKKRVELNFNDMRILDHFTIHLTYSGLETRADLKWVNLTLSLPKAFCLIM